MNDLIKIKDLIKINSWEQRHIPVASALRSKKKKNWTPVYILSFWVSQDCIARPSLKKLNNEPIRKGRKGKEKKPFVKHGDSLTPFCVF